MKIDSKIDSKSALPEVKKKIESVKKSKKESEINSKKDSSQKKSSAVKDVTPVVKIIDTKAIVDQYVPNRQNYHIYSDIDKKFNGKFFSATLNKSNLDKNNNKFFILQLLQSDTNKNCLLFFTRWGRIGVPGVNLSKDVDSVSGPKQFMKKYRDKIKVGYQEIFIDYKVEKKKEIKKEIKENKNEPKLKFKSGLDNNVLDLIRLIYNKQLINDNLHEIGYDSKKMPLGKLSSVTLTHGLNILKEIEKELKKEGPDKELLKKYSSQFYTHIPHDIGFKKLASFIIDTIDLVKQKIEMISALADMKITLNILENVEDKKDSIYENQQEKQLYDSYKELKCDIRSISKSEPIYNKLNKYLTAKIDKEDYYKLGHYYGEKNKLSLINAFEIKRQGEDKKFKDFGNKKLLWHGTRITNFVGILSQGLRIAPPEAPSSGYLYGKGVYFADMALKSSCYCHPVNREALILLGEVSLGNEDQRTDVDFSLPSTLKSGANSVHALSILEPNGGEHINGDVYIPNGEAKINKNNSDCNYHAEYIVYNTDQIKLKYILKIRYN